VQNANKPENTAENFLQVWGKELNQEDEKGENLELDGPVGHVISDFHTILLKIALKTSSMRLLRILNKSLMNEVLITDTWIVVMNLKVLDIKVQFLIVLALIILRPTLGKEPSKG